MWSTHSRRIDPISRSAKPFCQGEAGAVGFSTFGAKDRLDRMRRAAMGQAFSWTNSAKAYASLYQSSI